MKSAGLVTDSPQSLGSERGLGTRVSTQMPCGTHRLAHHEGPANEGTEPNHLSGRRFAARHRGGSLGRPPRKTRWPYSGRPYAGSECRRPSCWTTDTVLWAGAAARSRPALGLRPVLERLPTLNIGLINSRPYRPQTNGKPEHLRKSLEDEMENDTNG